MFSPRFELRTAVQPFFFNLTYGRWASTCHPACSHRRTIPSLPGSRLRFFFAAQVQHSYNWSTNGCILLTHVFTLSTTEARIKDRVLSRIEIRAKVILVICEVVVCVRLQIPPTTTLASCLGSRRVFPSLPGSRLMKIYLSRCSSSALLHLVNQWLHFTYSRSHAFCYGIARKIGFCQESISRLFRTIALLIIVTCEVVVCARVQIPPKATLSSCLWSRRVFPSLPGSRLANIYRDASSAL